MSRVRFLKRMTQLISLVLLLIVAGPAWAEQTGTTPEVVTRWIAEHAIPFAETEVVGDERDLESVLGIVGDARVIALGEGHHNIRQFHTMRNRIVQFLVRRGHISAVVLETGLAESKPIYDYVLGRTDEVSWRDGLSFIAWQHQETIDLIEWLRHWNTNRPADEQIRFYGNDWVGVRGSWLPSLDFVLDYMESVDPYYASTWGLRIKPIVRAFSAQAGDSLSDALASTLLYQALPAAQRDQLELLLNKAVRRMKSLRMRYLETSALDDYDWALRILINYQQTKAFLDSLAFLPQGAEPVEEVESDPMRQYLFSGGRDGLMAENLIWILEREGANSRLAYHAANVHIQRTPEIRMYVAERERAAEAAVDQGSVFSKDNAVGRAVLPSGLRIWTYPAGYFLDSMLGEQYHAMGFFSNRGEHVFPWTPDAKPTPIGPAQPPSVQAALASIGVPRYFLPLAELPESGPVYDYFVTLWHDTFTNYPTMARLGEPPDLPIPKRFFDSIMFVDEVSSFEPARYLTE